MMGNKNMAIIHKICQKVLLNLDLAISITAIKDRIADKQ